VIVGRRIRDEDELEELPPLDGDSRDQPEPDPDCTDLLQEPAEEATLDDTTAEDEPADASDLDLDHVEGGWLGEPGEAQDLNMGEEGGIVDFGDEASPLADVEEPDADDEDFVVGDAPERGGLDAGDEGPLDADEELRESDLPALDADEEGEMDDSSLVDAGFGSDEPLGLPWAAEPWPRVGAPVALVGATAVACAARGALVVGRSESGAAELVRVDLEGTCERLPAEGLAAVDVSCLAVEGPLVAAVVQGGRLLLSHDGGNRFAPAAEPPAGGASAAPAAARSTADDEPSASQGLGQHLSMAASDAVFGSGRLWVRTRAGGLVVLSTNADSPERSRQGGLEARGVSQRGRSTVERCAVPGIAAALTRDTATATSEMAVLVVDDGGRPTALVRAAAGAPIRREAIDAPEAQSPPPFAARGDQVAYAARRAGVIRRTSGGTWQRFVWEGRITALAFVDDAGTLIASTYSDADDTSALVRLDAGGKASVVARIGAAPADAESDGRVVAMAHDEARGVVWVVGGFGLAAFAVGRPARL
jgi:hypothetical protein